MEEIVEEGTRSSHTSIENTSNIKLVPGESQPFTSAAPVKQSAISSDTLTTLPKSIFETKPLLTRNSNQQVEPSPEQTIARSVLGKWGNENKIFSLGQDDSNKDNTISDQKKLPGSWKHLMKKVEILERVTSVWQKGRRAGARGARGTTGIFNTRDPPTDEEVRFLEAAEYGNIPTVRKMLEESSTLNVNCFDFMGQNALQLAVGNEHLEVVELLLKQPVMARIGDALLLAISKGYVRIAEIILNHHSFQVHDRLTRSPCEQRLLNQGEDVRNKTYHLLTLNQAQHKRFCEDTDFYAYDEDGTRFSPDITPIILAAQCQEYEIVHELLLRGACIERPHNYRCHCEECLFRKKLDSFSYSLSRINAYKGLASPAYLSLSSADPVLTALELSHELALLADSEKEFKKEYNDLAAQCDDFAEKLLDLCHDTEEVEVILNGDIASQTKADKKDLDKSKTKGKQRSGDGTTRKYQNKTASNQIRGRPQYPYNNNQEAPTRPTGIPPLKRLKTAIRYSVKRFVAHPNCQQQLLRLWQMNISWLWQSPFYYKFLFAFCITLCMPVLALIYILAPCTRAATLIKSPFCKFISHAMSYAQFLCLLVVNSSDRFEGNFIPKWFLVHQTKDIGRYTTFTWCEIIIMLYVLGFLWNECREVFDEGPREYMFKLWNIIDFFMLSIFLSSYTLRAISYYKVSVAQDWWDREFGENATRVVNGTFLNGGHINRPIPELYAYYAYSQTSREFWASSDPQLLSEALFSFGIVLSFSRIAYILPANEMFGPLQISLGRTIVDIVKWIVIFFMIFGAFILGLFNLYSYYGDGGTEKGRSFTTVEDTFIILFWSLFGLADYKSVEVKYGHVFTRLVGYQLYGAYNIISVIIMLNMLIAMINSSYSDVEKDADVEWKFARAKLWLSYFDDGKTLPVPYNIIPSPKSIYSNICKLCRFCRKLFRCKLFKNTTVHSNRLNQSKKRTKIKGSLSMSALGSTSSSSNKKQNGMKRSMTVSESEGRQWKGLSMKFKREQLSRYQIIMRRIVKRFVIRAQVEKDRDEVNEGELQEIKHDISSLRYELLESNANYSQQMNSILQVLQNQNSFPNIESRSVSSSKMIEEKKQHCTERVKTAQVSTSTDGLTRRNTLSTMENNQSQSKDGKGSRLSVGTWARPRSAVLQREMRRKRFQNVDIPSTGGSATSTGGDIWTVAGDPSFSANDHWDSTDLIQSSGEGSLEQITTLHTLDETIDRKRDYEQIAGETKHHTDNQKN